MAKAITLTSLPNELLDVICACLTRSSRCALALTCKVTKPSATAALYRTYTNCALPEDAPFHLFLRTICESPEHGALVKELDIRGWRSEQEVAAGEAWRTMVTRPVEQNERPTRTGPRFIAKMTSRFSSTATGEFDLFLKTAVNIGLVAMPTSTDHTAALKRTAPTGDTLEADADLIRQLKHGVEDSHFILLVAQLPNLEKLTIEGLTPYPILDWHHFLSRVGTALQSLKILNLSGSCFPTVDETVKTTLQIQILDLLPNLEVLQLVNLSAQGLRYTGKDILPSKKLRKVSFDASAVSHRLFGQIADGQRLESFLYVPDYASLQANPSAAFSGEQVAGYLESSKHSLKTLDLLPVAESKHSATREYINLEHLSVYFPGFIPWFEADESLEVIEDHLKERLPSSLKRLTLNRLMDSTQVTMLAKGVAALKMKGDLPHLGVLVMSCAPVLFRRIVGQPFQGLDKLKAIVEKSLGPVVTEGKLELKFEVSFANWTV